ncbi:hypothetical protein PPN31114_02299 [Pandoraea pneumonica]|uniref:Uncharacterized protein n=1 Tax=Pandoraea pneumonica TaxID=2508299 RepID=A0A5E4V0W7_9BURK|nr:hypothetical protein [Pandoraea pneumonica]VVE04410.1 hypothetical protein PPN31114_02299 [Pandoraea pneumonica]
MSRAIGVLGEAARQRVPPALLPFAHRTGFRAGPLRNLPSQRYLSGVLASGDAASIGVALMMVIRDALDPTPLDDIALRRRYMAMRDAILPRDAMRQRAILEQFAGGEARRLSDALGGLITLLAEHPQRDSLHAFASELILRGSTASRAICRNPLVAAMLAGLGVFGMPSCRGSSVM